MWCREKTLILLIIAVCSQQTACTRTYVVDHLEAYVAIGFGERKSVDPCPLKYRPVSLGIVAPCWDFPVDFVQGRPFPVWFKVVSSRDLSRPLPGRVIQLSVVDSRGIEVQGVTVNPMEVISDNDGYSADTISFTPNRLGVFRIKASYEDYGAVVWSYSPPISILSQ